jgi:hypothetical protein
MNVTIEKLNIKSGTWEPVTYPASMCRSLLRNQQTKYGRILFRLPEGVTEEALYPANEPIPTPEPAPCVGCNQKKDEKTTRTARKAKKATGTSDDSTVPEG